MSTWQIVFVSVVCTLCGLAILFFGTDIALRARENRRVKGVASVTLRDGRKFYRDDISLVEYPSGMFTTDKYPQ